MDAAQAGSADATMRLRATPQSVPGRAADTAATAYFDLKEAEVLLGHFDDGTFAEGIRVTPRKLSATGTAKLELAVVDEHDRSQLVEEPLVVQLQSVCAAASPPKATLPESVATSRGRAIAEYAVNGCDVADTVTASLAPIGSDTTEGEITFGVGVPSIAFLRFGLSDCRRIEQTGDAADDCRLFLRGTERPLADGAARPTAVDVFFEVKDADGAPLADQEVEFGLTSDLAGLALAQDDAVSDENGIVSTTLRAGNLPDRTRVRATMEAEDEYIRALSDDIRISSWIPDQNSFSIAATELNVAGEDNDGIEVEVTVRLADRFNNPSLDNTTVHFTTEYGAIDDFCRTRDGVCSVTWISQEPRRPLLAAATCDSRGR